MNTVVCPVLPFPNIYWWSKMSTAQNIIIDTEEHFEKMSFRNKYMVASPNGVQTLSIPLKDGRQQRKAMKEVQIDNSTNWQQQHWRSWITLYNRSPYFEFFAADFELLFAQKFDRLVDFSLSGIMLTAKLLRRKFELQQAAIFQKVYPDDYLDLRGHFRTSQYLNYAPQLPAYHQVFEDRCGFLPNLSIIDLLFAEARNAPDFLF